MTATDPDPAGVEPTDYDRALDRGRRAFYDRDRDRICSCPENYLLAVGTTTAGQRSWTAVVPVALLSRRGPIVHVIRMWQDNSDAEALADAIGKVLHPPTELRKVED